MIQFIKTLFGGGADMAELLANGATIVDVRSKAEYASGHLNKSINIPLDQLKTGLNKLDKNKPVITCCASGMRSASAKSILKSNGFENVHNGGGWNSLKAFDK
ncbi:MAG: rhodanese-like domain-containing protein [Ekhidna sp.]